VSDKPIFRFVLYLSQGPILTGSTGARRLRLDRVRVLVILAVFLAFSIGLVQVAQSQIGTQISQVFVDPLKSPTTPYNASGPPVFFNVTVRLNLDYGLLINVFDIVLDYSTASTGLYAVKPVSLDLSNNIFAGLQSVTAVECIDGNPINNTRCEPSDSLGSIHVTEGVLSTALPGGFANGPLFRVRFQVVGNGSSTFTFGSVSLVDPGSSQPYNPRNIPEIAKGGVWGNLGLIPFFNVFSSDSYPALLPGNPLIFDASGSFDANNTTVKIVKYSWIFGDNGTWGEETNASSTLHIYKSPGEYLVRLTITDANSDTGYYSDYIVVSPALGTLDIFAKNRLGESPGGGVVVQVSNSSWSFQNVTDIDDEAVFHGLTPGNYTVTLSGPRVVNSTRTEKVLPGLTFQDTFFLTLKPAPPTPPTPPDYRGLVYAGVLVVGLVAFGAVLFSKRISRARRTGHGRRGSSGRRKRPSRSQTYRF